MEPTKENIKWYLEVRESSESLGCDACGRQAAESVASVDFSEFYIDGILCAPCKSLAKKLKNIDALRLVQVMEYLKKIDLEHQKEAAAQAREKQNLTPTTSSTEKGETL
jgi:hypothetical protein